jgi:hypothetical protein
MRLRSREEIAFYPLSNQELQELQLALDADGWIADQSLYVTPTEEQPPALVFPCLTILTKEKGFAQMPLDGEALRPALPSIFGNWDAAPRVDHEGAQVLLMELKVGNLRAEITLEKANEVTVRVQKEVLMMADNRGRLLAMNLNSGHLIRNLRI